MTETELYSYLRAVSSLRREREQLARLEAVLREAPCPKISPLPPSGGLGEERVPHLTARLIEQQERVEEARRRLESADGLLTYVEALLEDESEREFLHNHYRLNMSYSAMSKKENRSVRSLHRDRVSILSKVRGVTYVLI